MTITSQVPEDSIPPRVNFEETKRKYPKLIPVMNGWFIAADSLDVNALLESNKKAGITGPSFESRLDSLRYMDSWMIYQMQLGMKWGVIDSAGRTIVPFICDGVRQVGADSLEYSVYKFSYSLNTGIPRYNYQGTLFAIDAHERPLGEPRSFETTIVFLSDFHQPEFVMQQGPGYFFPLESRNAYPPQPRK